MSDFKAMFKAAKAQRGTGIPPTKEQIKALKAQKAAAVASQPHPSSSAGGMAPAAPGPSSERLSAASAKPLVAAGAAKPAGVPAGLPSDFFQAPPPAARVEPSGAASGPVAALARANASEASGASGAALRPAPALGPTARAAAAAAPSTGVSRAAAAGVQGAAATTALPQGFFDDKADDAKARGVKLPDKQSKEAEFQEFTRAIEKELVQQAEVEEEEVAEDANLRDEREGYEQELRLQRLEDLRKRKAPGGEAPAVELPREQLGKRQRVVDALRQQLEGSDDDGGDEDDDSDEELLDWRAKAV